ncbi:transcription factor HES-2.2 [Puntigrus tetrazona]|uniref:transcription factor HES-2.2 n=1 Tax=Puntigrus tetrazona TaxID=1606681 RepID=UPI001C890979|nr:transcription factor HES-2.2 [Puntigrus tetrazona]
MAPNATAVTALTYAPRTVAMRKEANELRRTLKPLLEKKRRARINESLNRLKALILPLTGKDNCRYSKLEKADILEMTVKFLTDIQSAPSKDSVDSLKDGYTACLQRVSARLPQTGLDAETRHRVNDFIQHSVTLKTPACQNCCAQSSKMMTQIQQKLLNLKSSSSKTVTPEKCKVAIAGRPKPVPLIADSKVWRPW